MDAALDASARALAEARAALAAREQELRSSAIELDQERGRARDLDRVATRLAEIVVEHRKQIEALRAELAAERDRHPPGAGRPTPARRFRLGGGPEPDGQGGELVGERGDGVRGRGGKLHSREPVEGLLEQDP